MRLEILMGTQKSYFAYRLGWANTSSERIPFLPLHRRDLILAEDGNRTYLDAENTRINWKKFEIMGEVVISIQKSQATPYPTISRSEELQRLVLDGRFAKDDDVRPTFHTFTLNGFSRWRYHSNLFIQSLMGFNSGVKLCVPILYPSSLLGLWMRTS